VIWGYFGGIFREFVFFLNCKSDCKIVKIVKTMKMEENGRKWKKMEENGRKWKKMEERI
jgi:hypothetical protein